MASSAKLGAILDARWVVDPETGCWNWQGPLHPMGGYGIASVKGKTDRAHRHVYKRLVGPIPEGYDIHHQCENTRCVNPDHLEPLPQREHRQGLDSTKLRQIHELGADRSLTCRDIAERVGTTEQSVKNVLSGRRFVGIGDDVEIPAPTCTHCGAEMEGVRRDRKYCSGVCKSRAQRRRLKEAA